MAKHSHLMLLVNTHFVCNSYICEMTRGFLHIVLSLSNHKLIFGLLCDMDRNIVPMVCICCLLLFFSLIRKKRLFLNYNLNIKQHIDSRAQFTDLKRNSKIMTVKINPIMSNYYDY